MYGIKWFMWFPVCNEDDSTVDIDTDWWLFLCEDVDLFNVDYFEYLDIMYSSLN